MAFEKFSQWYIGIAGSIAFFLIATQNPWGFIFMLSTEPFWFISTWQKRQWGMFCLTTLYLISCFIGIYTGFFKKT